MLLARHFIDISVKYQLIVKVEMDLYTCFQKNNLTMVGTGSAFHGDYPYDSDPANFKVILRMMLAGMVRPAPVVTHCVPYTEGPRMYRMLIEEKDTL